MLPQRPALRAAVVCAPLSASSPVRAWGRIAFAYDREIFQINPKGRTADGERFQPIGRTAAIWEVPFNTRLRSRTSPPARASSSG